MPLSQGVDDSLEHEIFTRRMEKREQFNWPDNLQVILQ